jgi:hypothetical protein
VRTSPGQIRLAFLLPIDFDLAYDGPQPAANGCFLKMIGPVVEVVGRSREAVFEAATPLLLIINQMLERPISIAATLQSPPCSTDAWSIIVGADIAFSPTSLDPHFPRAGTA